MYLASVTRLSISKNNLGMCIKIQTMPEVQNGPLQTNIYSDIK